MLKIVHIWQNSVTIVGVCIELEDNKVVFACVEICVVGGQTYSCSDQMMVG